MRHPLKMTSINAIREALEQRYSGKFEVLIDSNGSLVLLIRNYLPAGDATALCESLKEDVQWRQDPIKMYGKLIPQPRKLFACGDSTVGTYRYVGIDVPVKPWILEVGEIRDRISQETGVVFDSCLMNAYRNGRDYIGFHSDREALGPFNAVVTVSLGGSRDFQFKQKQEPFETVVKTTLNSGDCVVMLGETQKQYTHSIPKRAQGDYRIALTYRLIKPNLSRIKT
jgi:alkylated DNA repair dioxygenase AlkB